MQYVIPADNHSKLSSLYVCVYIYTKLSILFMYTVYIIYCTIIAQVVFLKNVNQSQTYI